MIENSTIIIGSDDGIYAFYVEPGSPKIVKLICTKGVLSLDIWRNKIFYADLEGNTYITDGKNVKEIFKSGYPINQNSLKFYEKDNSILYASKSDLYKYNIPEDILGVRTSKKEDRKSEKGVRNEKLLSKRLVSIKNLLNLEKYLYYTWSNIIGRYDLNYKRDEEIAEFANEISAMIISSDQETDGQFFIYSCGKSIYEYYLPANSNRKVFEGDYDILSLAKINKHIIYGDIEGNIAMVDNNGNPTYLNKDLESKITPYCVIVAPLYLLYL
jgi:hypothetical protein